jgi:hypothetical protein
VVQLLAPGTGGVRDYAEGLSRHWRDSGLADHLIAFSQGDARKQSLASRLQQLIDAEGRPCTVLLHFSGYGFQPRGLCFWLLQQIESARRCLGPDLRVVTMFHELFASEPPWKSAFWVSGLQAWIAGSIARRSDGLWTNTEVHRRWLAAQVCDAVAVTAQPVFSTIGEPDTVLPTSQRRLQLVVFGAQSTRHRALARLPCHATQLRQHGVTEVIEVGSGESYRGIATDLRHRFMGRMETTELQALLEQSVYGLIDYPPKYLGKSTVFAAYAVHGCISLNTAVADSDTDGLRHGEHFVILNEAASIPGSTHARQTMADAARTWYSGHRSNLQAQAFAELCQANNFKEVTHA